MKKLFCFIFALLCATTYGQKARIDARYIKSCDSINNTYTLKEDASLKKSDISSINSFLSIHPENSFVLLRNDTDAVGNIVYEYKQFYQGIPVDKSSVRIHCDKNNHYCPTKIKRKGLLP